MWVQIHKFEVRKVWTTWVSSLGISKAFFGLLKIDLTGQTTDTMARVSLLVQVKHLRNRDS